MSAFASNLGSLAGPTCLAILTGVSALARVGLFLVWWTETGPGGFRLARLTVRRAGIDPVAPRPVGPIAPLGQESGAPKLRPHPLRMVGEACTDGPGRVRNVVVGIVARTAAIQATRFAAGRCGHRGVEV